MIKETKSFFERPDLDGRSFFLQGNKIGVLLIHGFTATTAEVRWLGDYLNRKGLTVHAPLLPGHGTTPQDLNNKNYQDWQNCVEDAYSFLGNTCSKILVGGESMGAVLSLYLAEKHPEISAVMLFSPAIKVAGLRFSNLLKYIKPVIRKKNKAEILPWQGYSVYPLLAASEFQKMQILVAAKLNRINQPTVIFSGAHDKTIDADSASVICSGICSQKKVSYLMNDSGHVILLDSEFDQIAQKTWDFIAGLKIL